MTTEERQNRILARGEHSGHAHIVVGPVTVEIKDGKLIVRLRRGLIIQKAEVEVPILRHLEEKKWVEEETQKWTEEHHDVPLPKNVGQSARQGDVLVTRVEDDEDNQPQWLVRRQEVLSPVSLLRERVAD